MRNPAASGASEPPRVFTMDHVFDESLPQATVYEETCRPIVSNIIQGQCCSVTSMLTEL